MNFDNNWRSWGGRVVQWKWVNFHCRGVLLILIIIGQGPIDLAMEVGKLPLPGRLTNLDNYRARAY